MKTYQIYVSGQLVGVSNFTPQDVIRINQDNSIRLIAIE